MKTSLAIALLATFALFFSSACEKPQVVETEGNTLVIEEKAEAEATEPAAPVVDPAAPPEEPVLPSTEEPTAPAGDDDTAPEGDDPAAAAPKAAESQPK